MSMPTITLPEIDLETAVGNLIASIALEESGLSHILNAEGMKLQHVIAREETTIQDLINIDESVTNTVESIAEIEESLASKLASVISIAQNIGPGPSVNAANSAKEDE